MLPCKNLRRQYHTEHRNTEAITAIQKERLPSYEKVAFLGGVC